MLLLFIFSLASIWSFAKFSSDSLYDSNFYEVLYNCAILSLTNYVILFQFATDKRSILPVGDISDAIPDEEADIAVLEEPEHLTWFHHGKKWKTKFNYVIGIVHTNYLEYVKREKQGRVKAFLLKYLNSWVVGIYCHKVIFFTATCRHNGVIAQLCYYIGS